MPGIEAHADPQELRRCIRDLTALSALPAIWRAYDPHRIAESASAAMLSIIDCESVHVSLPDQKIEIARVGRGVDPDSVAVIAAALREQLPRQPDGRTVISMCLSEGTLRFAFAPIGLGENAVLVVASRRTGFPTEAQQLLLGTCAYYVTLELERWDAEMHQRRLVALVERSSDLIGFASLDGTTQYLNPAGLEFFNLSHLDERRRPNVLDYVHPEDRARVRDELWPVMMQEGRWFGEMRLQHFATGAAIPFFVDWFRIDDPRSVQPMNIAAVCRDLTTQKRSEAELRHLNETLEQRVAARNRELADANLKLVARTRELEVANLLLRAESIDRRRMDARMQKLQLELYHAARFSEAGQMAAALAHELNQPLTAAANSASAGRRLLATGEPERLGEVREAMAEVAEQLVRAGQITRRDFISRGETEKQVESVAIMVDEASALALNGSSAIGVSVHFHFDPDASLALVNPIQIQQVLTNLIRNAIEAMTACSRRDLRITTARLNEETIEVAVSDTGIGLSADVAGRLFEPFVSTKPQGMGLGLSICKSIVEAHGGCLKCEPNPGGGAIFRFTVAAVGADDAK
jgi:PAS domain S-box-containing protein